MPFPTYTASNSISLRRLFPVASYVGCAEIAVEYATEQSRECRPGCLFAALPGTHVHGRDFVAEAIERGAASILTDRPIPNINIPQCILPQPREAFARLCHSLHGLPTRSLGVIGVTGTNGKTTTCWLTRAILEQAGRRTGLLGTIEYSDSRHTEPSQLTTPSSAVLARWLAAAVHHGADCFALELSSHALEQGRAVGTGLDVAIVTNIERDHLDYHPHWDDYRAAKAKIAGLLKRGGCLVLNADQPGSLSLLGYLPRHAQAVTFGIEHDADITASRIAQTATGMTFELRSGIETVSVTSHLIGRHNISNVLAAAAAALHLGLSLPEIAAGVQALRFVPGRLQQIDQGQPFRLFIDYAHTAEALQRVLSTLRSTTDGRIICVFGAGGDRDRTKRAPMGAAASAADLVVLTSDNPRREDPSSIIEEIAVGVDPSRTILHRQPDRAAAIAYAIDCANPEDTVLIAGKGHETYQIIGERKIPFRDADVCMRLLAEKQVTSPSLQQPV